MDQEQQKSDKSGSENSIEDFVMRMGIICTPYNIEDVLSYKNELIRINKELGDRVKIILFGYDGKGDEFEGLKYEYVKPVSIIHYFKQLKALELNLLFIPLIRSVYNATSENYNKFLEAGLFNVPVIALKMYPYKQIITDKMTGFLYNDKSEFFPNIEHLSKNPQLLQLVGENANTKIKDGFDYDQTNIEVINQFFQ